MREKAELGNGHTKRETLLEEDRRNYKRMERSDREAREEKKSRMQMNRGSKLKNKIDCDRFAFHRIRASNTKTHMDCY